MKTSQRPDRLSDDRIGEQEVCGQLPEVLSAGRRSRVA